MKTLIVAGSHRETQAWLWEQSNKDPFKAAIRKANGVQLWDNYHYVGREQDLMGRDRKTPVVFVGCFWESPVYDSPLLREFTLDIPPMPSTAFTTTMFGQLPKYSGIDMAKIENAKKAMQEYCATDLDKAILAHVWMKQISGSSLTIGKPNEK